MSLRSKTLQTLAVALLLALPAVGTVLSLLQILRDNSALADGLGKPLAVAASPDGRHVYVAAHADDAISVFARDATNESLTWRGMVQEGVGGVFGLLGASGVAVSADSRLVFAAAEQHDALTVFARDATSDALAFRDVHQQNVGGTYGLDGAWAVTSQGRFVYVASHVSGSLAVFVRDASADTVAFVTAFLDGSGGVHGLAGADGVAASPDGTDVFVAAADDDALVVFRRDLPGGPLSYRETLYDGFNGVDGLDGAAAVAVSPDGRQVFVASRFADALVVFSRTAAPPPYLRPLAVFRERQGGVDGLAGASSVALNPAGTLVFVGGSADDGVAVFRREPATGAVAFLARVTSREQLDAIQGLVASADGRQLYAVSLPDALLAFHVDGPLFETGFEGGSLEAWSAFYPTVLWPLRRTASF